MSDRLAAHNVGRTDRNERMSSLQWAGTGFLSLTGLAEPITPMGEAQRFDHRCPKFAAALNLVSVPNL